MRKARTPVLASGLLAVTLLAVTLLAVALLAACTRNPQGEALANPAGVVTGKVTYLQRIALPADATLNLRLEDVTRADAPSVTIAAISIPTAGRSVPLAFELPYEPTKIDPNHLYSVRATLDFGNGTVYRSTQANPVLTRGHPASVEIVVQP
jgi:putative lipoprotein